MTFGFAAAGTGGHVYPALAVAEALVERGVDRSDVVFFGGDRMEARVVPAAGFPFVPVEIRGLRRSLDLDNLQLPRIVWRARAAIRSDVRGRSMKVMVGFGGYVTVPAAWAAVSLGVPVFLQEQNAQPGLANRLMARRARETFIAFPAAAPLARSRLVGNPLRPAFDTFDRSALRHRAKDRYELPESGRVLGVIGGSLGARILNDLVTELVGNLDPDVALLHLTGTAHIEEVTRRAEGSSVTWRPIAFEESMEYFYAASDLVLSRAGALTVSELAVTGTPAVVVPYAAGTAGHQAANAAELASGGAVELIPETDAASVPGRLLALLADDERRRRMGEAALAQARPGAAGIIADTLLEAL